MVSDLLKVMQGDLFFWPVAIGMLIGMSVFFVYLIIDSAIADFRAERAQEKWHQSNARKNNNK